jgi:hypothetical protein
LKLGYCQLGAVAYLGPAETARRLRTIAALRLEDARRLPKDSQRRLLTARSWDWPELAEPRQLAEQLAGQAGLKIANPERIEHDLWPAAELPPLSWVERMTLVLAPFDLTFRFDRRGQIELVELPADPALVRTYAGGANPGRWPLASATRCLRRPASRPARAGCVSRAGSRTMSWSSSN